MPPCARTPSLQFLWVGNKQWMTQGSDDHQTFTWLMSSGTTRAYWWVQGRAGGFEICTYGISLSPIKTVPAFTGGIPISCDSVASQLRASRVFVRARPRGMFRESAANAWSGDLEQFFAPDKSIIKTYSSLECICSTSRISPWCAPLNVLLRYSIEH